MRNVRSINLTQALIEKHSLSTMPPPPDALFWTMWNACTDIAAQALQAPFIQGIGSGMLDPVKYGAFNVSDAYYCFNGAEDYLIAESQATDQTLKMFLLQKYEGYNKYNQTFPQIWHIRDASGVVPIPVCKEYAQFESDVASHQNPIYCLITMIPCEYLWNWLASQLPQPSPQNLYGEWITSNNDPSGAFAMGNFLNDFMQKNPRSVDPIQAINLYKTAMSYEQQNFFAATG